MDTHDTSTTPNAIRSAPEQGFETQFSGEILKAQRLRTYILSGLFVIVLIFLLGSWIYFKASGRTDFPVIVPVIVGLIAAYMFAMRWFIDRRIRDEKPVASLAWYLNAVVEISAPTIAMLFTRSYFEHPIYVLSAPPVLAYFLFITLSTLQLNFGVSLFTGLIAAGSYLAVGFSIFQDQPPDSRVSSLFQMPFLYVGKAMVILVTGIGAAFIARELYRRVMRTLGAVEERNRTEEANRLKSQFLANMSHEIRTPLNAILGYAQLLDGDSKLSSEQRQSVQTIATSGNHLLGLINDVLDLSKIESGREKLFPVDFDLAELMVELRTMFRLRCEQKGLAWEVETEPGGRRVHGDENKLRQVLVNLLGNAVKFTEAGRVGFSLTVRPEDRYLFEVFDTGPGIPEAQQAAIFEPFYQTDGGVRKGGTGLGLAIAHRHVQLMGGELGGESAPGSGTRFTFSLTLPPAREADRSESDAWSQVAHLASGCSVDALVVDDVAENRALLGRMLRRVGVEVRLAENGLQAVARCGEGVPDIVFMDIRMADMSGQETRQRLIEAHGEGRMVMVAVSASVLEHEHRSYLEAGFDAFIDKPVQMWKVYACLTEHLGVTYTYEAPSEPEAVPVDLSRVVLPEAVFRSLKEAAEFHSITQFREPLDDVAALGEAGQQLAAHLRDLVRQFDMEAVLNTLDEIPHE